MPEPVKHEFLVLLALNVIETIATAGRMEGGSFNLGVAPALLAVMLLLLWVGSGRPAVDAIRERHIRSNPPGNPGRNRVRIVVTVGCTTTRREAPVLRDVLTRHIQLGSIRDEDWVNAQFGYR